MNGWMFSYPAQGLALIVFFIPLYKQYVKSWWEDFKKRSEDEKHDHLTVKGIQHGKYDEKTHEYGVYNLCKSAAIYKRKPDRKGHVKEKLKSPEQDKSAFFPNLDENELANSTSEVSLHKQSYSS